MGKRYTFQCNKCDYNVESAGDESMGMQAVVSPYICNDCNIALMTPKKEYICLLKM